MLRALIGLFALAALSFGATAQEKRVALIIAQQRYDSSLGALPSTAEDARLMESALRAAGFQTRVVQNLGRQALIDESTAFAKRLAEDPKNTVGFYYYSGHGAAARKRGVNYLIPVGERITSSIDLAARGVEIDGILDAIEEAGAKAAFVVLDACRNVPFADQRSGERGLVAVPRKTDMVVAFSTEPGNTADADSLFSRTLAQRLRMPGLNDLDVFEETKSVVGRSTNRRQVPRIENGLLDRFVFIPGTAKPADTSGAKPAFDPRQVELSFWESIKNSRNKADFEAYLKQYPNGVYSALARNRIAELTAKPADPKPSEPAVAVPKPQEPVPQRTDPPVAGRFAPGQTFRDCADCPEMVVVPAGSFIMGSPLDEAGRDADEEQHRVSIRENFAVGKFEVTYAQWDACVAAGGCNGHRPDDVGWGRGQRPVMRVSWDDAKAYVKWLSGKTGQRYRLLSEPEWEYAARAGSSMAYPWGNEIGNGNANCDGCGSQWDKKQTAPVGSFKPNKFGLFDMTGNVFEWVEDCWNENYKGAPVDGSARTNGECGRRVLRGGSWINGPRLLRSAFRNWYSSEIRGYNVGFRLARTL